MEATNELVPDSKKRTFGNELPDTSIRRRMVDPSTNPVTDRTTVAQSQAGIAGRTSKKVVDESDLKRSIGNVQNYQFGPFAPTHMCLKTILKQIKMGCRSIANSPQYQNQAVRDIFGHFMRAWNLYYSQVVGG
ncbi:hypothetical protein POM88_044203 [Heracleum sosnowskyi]|uniref:Uncharacterized protein n=1 Tax=Heracleum sosnowskyi TaxID=360622 RepID=A0AAD8H4W8_9APIA|nr:hypothetical protein POM88_044203 [Heracleum sosnowskyi]